MTAVKLKVAELRKRKGIGQQELAEVLGITYQAVSKWETGITMPDIMLLPAMAEYFEVSVDELLGLKPLKQQSYIPRDSDNRDNCIPGSDKLYKNRKYFWNNDYLEFIINQVWKIGSPVNIIEFRCGAGYFGKQVLNLLPKGSTYTGVMSRRIDRIQAEAYIKRRSEIIEYFKDRDKRKSFLKVQGLLISYGRTAVAAPFSDCGC